MSKLIRVDVPEEVFDTLTVMAAAEGKKIGAFVKALLIAEAERKPGVSTGVSTGVSKAEWAAFLDWAAEEWGGAPPPIPTEIKTKTGAVAWGRAVGFRWEK